MSSGKSTSIKPEDLESFTQHLQLSKRILTLLGAGLSASSGLPTFRGAGGFWRTYDATYLATPEAFESDPGLVWQFYSYRRHMALNAKPNRAHLALAELARKKGETCVTLSQNVDGLSPRAGHPADQLKLLHGSLFDIKCENETRCGYVKRGDFTDPIVPALAIPQDVVQAQHETESELKSKVGKQASKNLTAAIAKNVALVKGLDISDASVPIPELSRKDLPQCPQCKAGLLRPGVVWFGESLPVDVMASVDEFVSSREKIDLMLLIGTSSVVYPAAGYTQIARAKGARVAVINMDKADARGMVKGDWFFEGEAGEIVPEILKSVVGDILPFESPGDGAKAADTRE